MNRYQQTQFIKSAAKVSDLIEDTGYEVAFAGRSNAGKSSALNCLTGIRQLARTSKTPGRTQLINLFQVGDVSHRLVDLPGYGYAKVSEKIKQAWQMHLAQYLEVRQSLKGLVLVMDIRHPLKPLDQMMIEWSIARHLPLHLLLTKSDKLSKTQAQQTRLGVEKIYEAYPDITCQTFSSLKKDGLVPLLARLDDWLAWGCLKEDELA